MNEHYRPKSPRRHPSSSEPPVGKHEMRQKDSKIVADNQQIQYRGEPTRGGSYRDDDERRPLSQATMFDAGQDRSRDGRGEYFLTSPESILGDTLSRVQALEANNASERAT